MIYRATHRKRSQGFENRDNAYYGEIRMYQAFENMIDPDFSKVGQNCYSN